MVRAMVRAPPPEDEVHIWLSHPDEIADAALLEAYHALLSPDERARRLRYYFDEHRHEYLITRALVRTVLSRYADVEPAAWVFEANAYGRPEIAGAEAALRLRFNLSNTKGLVVCAVTDGRDVGIDVEDAERASRALDIADRFFSPSEVAALRALPEGEQAERFVTYWTLKESYIKARGMGLAIPLDHFSFAIEEGRPTGISFDESLNDDPAAWQFIRFRPTRRHRIAAAIRRGPGEPVRALVRRTVPLVL